MTAVLIISIITSFFTFAQMDFTVAYWADVYDVPVHIASAVMYIESYCYPYSVGQSGEFGPMQVMPGTAEYIQNSTGISAEEIMSDPAVNIQAGVWYLSLWYHRFGNIDMALAAYNKGPAPVIECNCVPEFAQYYVNKVHGHVGVYCGIDMKELDHVGANCSKRCLLEDCE